MDQWNRIDSRNRLTHLVQLIFYKGDKNIQQEVVSLASGIRKVEQLHVNQRSHYTLSHQTQK